MNTAKVTYEATDNLRAMEAAVNYHEFLRRRIVSSAGHGNKLLDFGAGLGTHAARVRDALSAEVVCIEPDEDLVQQLRHAGFEAHTSLGDVAEASIDFAYSLNVLEHIPEDEQTLRELSRRLKRGGRLYLYVPAFPLLFSAMDRKVGHQRRYRRRVLEEKVRAAGLVVESSDYVDPIGFFATLAYRLIPATDGGVTERSVGSYDRWMFPISLRMQPLTRSFVGKNLELVARKG